MESGTAETSTTVNGANGSSDGAATRADRGPQPGDRRVGRQRSQVDSPEPVAEIVARVRANQAEWEALGNEGRYHWLGKLRDWLLDNAEQIADTMQAETGKVRGDTATELDLPHRPDQLLRDQGREVHRRRSGPAPLAAAGLEEAQRPVPPLPGGRRDQPLELPAGAGARRRDPGAAGRRRGGRQALRVHAAGPGRGDRGLEEGDRRARRLRLRPRDRRGRWRTWSTTVDFIQFTGSDRTGPQGDGPGRRDADPGQPRARRQGPDDRPLRRRPRPRRQRRRLGRDVSTPARSASRSSGSTSRSRSTTSSSPSWSKRSAALRQGADGRGSGKDVGAMTSPNQSAIVEDQVDDALANGARALTGGKARRGPRRLLRADRAGRRRPLDEGDARRDLRPGRRRDEGARLRGGAAPRQRHPLRARRPRSSARRTGPSASPAGSRPARSTSTT